MDAIEIWKPGAISIEVAFPDGSTSTVYTLHENGGDKRFYYALMDEQSGIACFEAFDARKIPHATRDMLTSLQPSAGQLEPLVVAVRAGFQSHTDFLDWARNFDDWHDC